MRKLIVPLTMAFVVLFAPAALASHSDPFHWRKPATDTQLRVFLIPQFDSQRYDWPLDHAVSVWTANPRVAMSVASSCPTSAYACISVVDEYKANGRNGLANIHYWPCDWSTTPPFPGRCHIVDATVTFNSYYPMSSSYLRYLTCHEVGHALALGHSSQPDGCMYHTSAGGSSPSDHDDDTLINKYTHGH